MMRCRVQALGVASLALRTWLAPFSLLAPARGLLAIVRVPAPTWIAPARIARTRASRRRRGPRPSAGAISGLGSGFPRWLALAQLYLPRVCLPVGRGPPV